MSERSKVFLKGNADQKTLKSYVPCDLWCLFLEADEDDVDEDEERDLEDEDDDEDEERDDEDDEDDDDEDEEESVKETKAYLHK
ncbi:unnamed protein product [Taenia asiatica]|uniref:Uncharacterized protein n=1 Tax=Taenia asiatica TaxID=60517 RepID=A0A0R3W1Y5_TAEAS|nr:unnamed protein product [Taenia asiatica]